MTTKEMIESAVDHLRTSASAKTVYGDPVKVDGKTVIPVARVAYGFGGGTGKKSATGKAGEAEGTQTGEGAGGGVFAKPLGVVEITPGETRFVPLGLNKRLAVVAAIGSGLGLLLGILLGRRSRN